MSSSLLQESVPQPRVPPSQRPLPSPRPARPGPGLLGADGLLLDVCAGVSGEGPGL